MSIKNFFVRQATRHNKYICIPVIGRKYQERNEEQSRKYIKNVASALFGASLFGISITDIFDKNKNVSGETLEALTVTNIKPDAQKGSSSASTNVVAGCKRPDLPFYSAEEVSKHDQVDDFWVTYKNGVYDVTKFLASHPGGEQILNAAGHSIEPFWNVYGMHKTPQIYELLESFRIGNLNDDDVVDQSNDDLWAREPRRDKRLIVRTAKPFNAEIPPDQQIMHFDTPNELFYVRQHMPVPDTDELSHSLKISIHKCNGSITEHKLSLTELGRFKRREVRAALMCAGNRRSEMAKQVKPVKGIDWTAGAISNAVWGGVYLRELLLHYGVDEENTDGLHIIFTGSDIDATGEHFSTSIPLDMALNPNARILLATHMNGEPLPPDHGYPLRVIVPGAPAVRSVKWLIAITISDKESQSHWHKDDYRAFNPSKTWETADFSTAPPVYSLPVTSAICDPSDGSTVPVKNGYVEVKGYAFSGGGAKILRVDVTTDCGATWVEASPVAMDDAPPNKHYAWMLWQAKVPVQKGVDQLNIWVKATDSNFNTQPEKFDDIWNIRGILGNAYHKITVKLK